MSARGYDVEQSGWRRWQRVGTRPLGVLGIAFVAWCMAAMDQSLFGYAVPGAMKDFGIGIESVGLIISISFLFGMVAPIVAGVLADRWGPRLLLAVCLGVSSLLVFAQGLAASVLVFGLLRVLSYGLSGALAPITSAMVANTAPARHSAMYIAILQAAYPFGWFLAAVAVVPLAGDDNWRAPFNIALLVVPIAILLYFLMPPGVISPGAVGAAKPAGHSLRTLFSMQHRSKALLAALAFFFYGGAIGGSAFFLPTYFQEFRGYTPSMASTIVGFSFGIAVLGYLGAAWVAQTRFGSRRTTLLWSVTGASLLLLSIWVPPNLWRDLAVFGLTAIFLFGTSSILTTYALEIFPPEIRATAMATCGTTALTAGYMAFPILTARVVEMAGWGWSFSLVIVPAVLVAALVIAVMPEPPRAAAAAGEASLQPGVS